MAILCAPFTRTKTLAGKCGTALCCPVRLDGWPGGSPARPGRPWSSRRPHKRPRPLPNSRQRQPLRLRLRHLHAIAAKRVSKWHPVRKLISNYNNVDAQPAIGIETVCPVKIFAREGRQVVDITRFLRISIAAVDESTMLNEVEFGGVMVCLPWRFLSTRRSPPRD